jgi:hypothetical protein
MASLYVSVGFDLAYAWSKTLENLHDDFQKDFCEWANVKEDSFSRFLLSAADSIPYGEWKVWFESLHELYMGGLAQREFLEAFSENLQEEQSRELETHVRTLPQKINILLILFFLPPVFFLLMAPLVVQLVGLNTH